MTESEILKEKRDNDTPDSEILKRKKSGDIPEVARMLNISKGNADVLLRRPRAKRHKEAIKALALIIEAREDAHRKNLAEKEKYNLS
jgi:hypothetical protein